MSTQCVISTTLPTQYAMPPCIHMLLWESRTCKGCVNYHSATHLYRTWTRADLTNENKTCEIIKATSTIVLPRYDYVEVRDGVDESGQLVGKYCGKIAPSPVVSSGNQLFIKFVSDYETHGAGFSIRYEIFKTGGLPARRCSSLKSWICLVNSLKRSHGDLLCQHSL